MHINDRNDESVSLSVRVQNIVSQVRFETENFATTEFEK